MSESGTIDALVASNLGLVHTCAARFRGRGIEYDDLYGAGCLGLVKAARGFDPSRGFAFSTYAVPVILGEIRRLFRDGGAVKIGRTAKERAAALLRTAETLRERLRREPTVGELAAAAGTDLSETAALLYAMLPPVSLTPEEGAETQIPVESGEDEALSRLALEDALQTLDETDRRLVRLRYYEGATQQKTGEALHLTQVQVSRREKKILLRLREIMTG